MITFCTLLVFSQAPDNSNTKPIAHLDTPPFVKGIRHYKIPSCPAGFSGKGTLVVSVITNPDGSIASANLNNNSDSSLINTPVSNSILAAIKNWRFGSYTNEGTPVMIGSSVPFNIDCSPATHKISVPGLTKETQ
jgi:outer membrane biosynthesis protein TonB